jgi:hypothetical protein
MVYTASLPSFSNGPGVFAVATCPGNILGGRTWDRLSQAAIPVTSSATVAASALATAMSPNTVAWCVHHLAGDRWWAAVVDRHCAGVFDVGRTEAGKRGDDPTGETDRPHKGRRYLR